MKAEIYTEIDFEVYRLLSTEMEPIEVQILNDEFRSIVIFPVFSYHYDFDYDEAFRMKILVEGISM